MSRHTSGEHRYYMLNKPAGTVSACRDREHPTVLDCFPEAERPGLFPMGRLDKQTEGFLLITDDGKLNRKMLDPDSHQEKRYLLWAAGVLTEDARSKLEQGIPLKGLSQPLRGVSVRLLATGTLGDIPAQLFPNRQMLALVAPETPVFQAQLTLTEGKRHQIKRMLEAVDCTVVYLKRTHFGGLELDERLSPGAYRPLTPEEIALLRGTL